MRSATLEQTSQLLNSPQIFFARAKLDQANNNKARRGSSVNKLLRMLRIVTFAWLCQEASPTEIADRTVRDQQLRRGMRRQYRATQTASRQVVSRTIEMKIGDGQPRQSIRTSPNRSLNCLGSHRQASTSNLECLSKETKHRFYFKRRFRPRSKLSDALRAPVGREPFNGVQTSLPRDSRIRLQDSLTHHLPDKETRTASLRETQRMTTIVVTGLNKKI